MKIIITHAYFLAEDKNEQKIMMPYPPLGMLYISAYLEEHELPNAVFDSTFETTESLYKYLLDEKPDYICIYANLMTKPNVVRLMKFIKSSGLLKDVRIILGGPDIRYNKAHYLLNGADYLVIGEGEATVCELIKALSNKQRVDNVPGITFNGPSGELITTPDRNLLPPDSLPFPARYKINIDIYIRKWNEVHGFSSLNISTMRGCPFVCSWCSKAVYGKTNRRRNPKLVVDEIDWMIRHYQFEKIWFVDDVFTLNKQWLAEFADELSLRHIQIHYECITRADQLTGTVIQLLRESGCYRVWIGAESGSQKVLDLMNRKVTIEEVQKAIISVKNAGMQAGTFIMLGYPGEEEKDIIATVKHLKRSDPDFYTITLTYPITGTELYNEVKLSGSAMNDWENTTDRQYDFERTYPKQYYKYAIQYVQREMEWHKSRKNGKVFRGIKHKIIALCAKLKMKQISIF